MINISESQEPAYGDLKKGEMVTYFSLFLVAGFTKNRPFVQSCTKM